MVKHDFIMKAVNKLDKSFGPSGSTAGIVLFSIGVIITFSNFLGLILILLGAFLGFTFTCTEVDFDTRRIKFTEKLFGIIPTGKWVRIELGMKIGIKESNITWRTFSRSNRSIDTDVTDFRLILFDADDKEIMPVKKTNSLESALAERKILCNKLELSELN
jgi:hypothetical protein